MEKLKFSLKTWFQFSFCYNNLLLLKCYIDYESIIPLDSRLRHGQLSRFWSHKFGENTIKFWPTDTTKIINLMGIVCNFTLFILEILTTRKSSFGKKNATRYYKNRKALKMLGLVFNIRLLWSCLSTLWAKKYNSLPITTLLLKDLNFTKDSECQYYKLLTSSVCLF